MVVVQLTGLLKMRYHIQYWWGDGPTEFAWDAGYASLETARDAEKALKAHFHRVWVWAYDPATGLKAML